jgi:beta-mannosidase
LLQGRDEKGVFLWCELQVGGKTVSANEYFFDHFKNLSLPAPRVSVAAAPARSGFRLTLKSDKLARDVYLSLDEGEGFFSDNYFDLVPGRPVEVEFRTRRPVKLEDFRGRLKVRSLVEAFR